MSWSIKSQTDKGRWLDCGDGMNFTADGTTTLMLSDLRNYDYDLTPTGPTQRGVTTPSHLYGAVLRLIPNPEVTGDHPPHPPVPSVPGVIY